MFKFCERIDSRSIVVQTTDKDVKMVLLAVFDNTYTKQIFSPTERQEQRALKDWLELNKIPFYIIPNGGSRHLIEAYQLKLDGVQAGVPDICIPVKKGNFGSLYIEIKRRRGGRVTKEQKGWIDKLNENGQKAVVCYGWEEACLVILDYMTNKS